MKASPPEDVDPTDALYLFDPDATHTWFMLSRAQAIEQYAFVEEALAQRCAYGLGVSADVSGVMFFRVNNARSRLYSIERLLKKKHGTEFNLFWNSLVPLLRNLDEERNKIVHRIAQKSLAAYQDGTHHRWSALIAPNWLDRSEGAEAVGLEDIYHFILKCHFLSQLVLHFRLHLEGEAKVSDPTWQRIFREPCSYPLPSTHPLFRNWKERGSPPQPSLPK